MNMSVFVAPSDIPILSNTAIQNPSLRYFEQVLSTAWTSFAQPSQQQPALGKVPQGDLRALVHANITLREI